MARYERLTEIAESGTGSSVFYAERQQETACRLIWQQKHGTGGSDMVDRYSEGNESQDGTVYMGVSQSGKWVRYDDYAALQSENERLKSVIYGRSSGSNLNELFGNSEELLVAIRGFIGASWMPAKEESTEEMRQTYSYWHKRLIKAVGTMGYFDAEEVANHCAGSDRHVSMIDGQANPNEPEFRDRSTHFVYRGSSGYLPCYCHADADHMIGDEQPTKGEGE